MARENQINIDEPGKSVAGGVFIRISWDDLSDILQRAGPLNDREYVDAVEITQHGISIRISKI